MPSRKPAPTASCSRASSSTRWLNGSAPRVTRARSNDAPLFPLWTQRGAHGRSANRWRGPESNRRHHGFQPCALPTELPRLESSSLAAILFEPPERQTVLVPKAGAPSIDQLREHRLGLLATPADGAREVGS